ncbi:uncharacterized protein LOC108147753 isoform X2 [Drosophila elegans]|uniref:uncharacterized protein LOC108147753 isoform X2 n=1 Tax=Drosophila elegans TaxID=30023 RepID=UPI0007E8A6A7|nr:uncharacterized protein LOC108147753 isoform X2 [Drosophila elegans]
MGMTYGMALPWRDWRNCIGKCAQNWRALRWSWQRQEEQKKPQEIQDSRKHHQDADADVDADADAGQVSVEQYHTPQAKWVDLVPSAMMSQAMNVDVCQAQHATPLSAYQFMEQHGSMAPEPLTPFFLEDSDLEHEYADRQGYMRYVEARPEHSSSDWDPVADQDQNQDERVPANPVPSQPRFVELEKRPHRVSLLRSLSPMRYTSQRSQDQDNIEVPPPELRHAPTSRMVKGQRPVGVQSRRTKGPGQRSHPSPPGAASPPRTLRPTGRTGGGDEAVALQPTTFVPSTGNNATKCPNERQNKRRRTKPLVVYSKSLEDLKFEKLGIYNRISLTQERIINALDKLQASLLQLQVPHCSAQERQKRQRNAFEFCVRFSRNFLYPLKGMIDDVRLTAVASFSSATSNEACQRVVCVYGLMQQSLHTYQRQLRYFLLEKVPQKLSALIEMIYTMTNCCLDKGVLDRQDPVVECLQERCTRFLSFIEDMQEERLKLARETLRRLHKQQGHQSQVQGQGQSQIQHDTGVHSYHRKKKSLKSVPPRIPTQPRQEKLRSHERYDLKMCLNDLKLYEPRLVPKERQQAEKRPQRMRRPRINTNSHTNTNTNTHPNVTATPAVASGPTGPLGELPFDPETQGEVQTQMQKVVDGGTTSSLSTLPTLGPMGQWSKEEQLHRTLLDALHLVSRSQVQQVLDPLMRSLRGILDEKLHQSHKQ